MNKIIFLFLLLTSTLFSQPNKTFYIDKNDKGGFNIYSNSGELLYEYTELNTDSVTLSTLDNIFYKTKTDNIGKQPVAVINLQDNGFNWLTLILSFVGIGGTLLAGLLTNRQNKKYQFEHYKRTTKDEEIDKWINELKNNISSFFNLINQFDIVLNNLNFKLNSTQNFPRDVLNSMVANNSSLELVYLNLNILLNTTDAGEKLLFKKLSNNYLTLLESAVVLQKKHRLFDDIRKLEKKISSESENTKLKEELNILKNEFEGNENQRESKHLEYLNIKNELTELVKSVITHKEQQKSPNKGK